MQNIKKINNFKCGDLIFIEESCRSGINIKEDYIVLYGDFNLKNTIGIFIRKYTKAVGAERSLIFTINGYCVVYNNFRKI